MLEDVGESEESAFLANHAAKVLGDLRLVTGTDFAIKAIDLM